MDEKEREMIHWKSNVGVLMTETTCTHSPSASALMTPLPIEASPPLPSFLVTSPP